jgi:uncharacterized protein
MPIAVYHKNCNDGTTAAAVFLRRFPDAKTFALHHQYSREDIVAVLAAIDAETEVYTLDCGIGVEEYVPHAHSVTTLDHHEGVREIFSQLAQAHNNYTYLFDNNKSGATLSWDYFFPEQSMPRLAALVEDADLWLWNYGDETKEVNAYLTMLQNEPERVAALFDEQIEAVRVRGADIAHYTDHLIRRFAVGHTPMCAVIGTHRVPLFNNVYFTSALGNLFAEKHGCAVGVFHINGDTVRVSFRSRDGQSPSALELAGILGGGGHRNAGAATVPLQEFIGMITHDI